ncbi:hypothetical protein F4861DRAFT_524999 [Xylaria intraflava]|nr:hypothetical protein F4861DRAFT_524999 [Xylaria intraflava]
MPRAQGRSGRILFMELVWTAHHVQNNRPLNSDCFSFNHCEILSLSLPFAHFLPSPRQSNPHASPLPLPRHTHTFKMADQITEFFDVQKDFVKDGTQFINRCTKPDRNEYIKICQAVGVGFVVMGAIGYLVKLIHIPVNNVLVGGA